MDLKFATADVSFALCRDRNKLGIAIVAMIKIIATTMSSSSSEKPLLVFKVPSFQPARIPSYGTSESQFRLGKEGPMRPQFPTVRY